MPAKIAAEVRDFEPGRYMSCKRAKRLDLSTLYGIGASTLAAKDAGVDFEKMDSDRAGVVEAISLGGTQTTIDGVNALRTKNYRSINAFSLVNGYTGGGSGEIALHLGIHGHAVTFCAGSASGNEALGYAFNLIKQDEVDVMVAGGTEAPLLPELWAVFSLTKVMTSQNQSPKSSMKPFDQDRDGFLLGEGSAFLILEELSHALARGAKIYAEVIGHGRSCEAYHSVAPHPDGIGVYRAMEKAMRQARINPSDVDYINVHGTATASNDLVETKAIKNLFQSHASKLALSSTKPVTGHLLGASGALETVICALALQREVIPLTLNHKNPAEGCDLDYVTAESRPYPIRVAMNLNSGFGGKNSCLILKQNRKVWTSH
jgi:3-oxoacyl-[acyl-carrier-protein] synthase II